MTGAITHAMPICQIKKQEGVKGSKKRLLCDTGAVWEKEKLILQTIFGVQTWALGLRRGRTGIGDRIVHNY
jgi:hypothetical protein